jgi:hypothetical protein
MSYFLIRSIIEKEQAEIKDALAEEENLRVHTEHNNLKEWYVVFVVEVL